MDDPEELINKISSLEGLVSHYSWSAIIAALIFSVIGLWMFRQGKRNGNYKVLIIGIALMFYGYFTPGAWMAWGVGTALCLLAKKLW